MKEKHQSAESKQNAVSDQESCLQSFWTGYFYQTAPDQAEEISGSAARYGEPAMSDNNSSKTWSVNLSRHKGTPMSEAWPFVLTLADTALPSYLVHTTSGCGQ